MKNLLSGILLLFQYISVTAQTTYRVQDFSPKYYAEVTIPENGEKDLLTPGIINIYNKKTNALILSHESEELSLDIKNQKVVANVKQLPYGEQSALISEDFNFDGMADLALRDGSNSCYGGPSFTVYLAIRNGFRKSPEFTDLAQSYCGMFSLEPETKTLSTMTKSGCCWHQFSEFKVINDKPVPIYITEEAVDATGFTVTVTEQKRMNGNMRRKSHQLLLKEQLEPVCELSFTNKKEMGLYQFSRDTAELLYVFMNAEGHVELIYDGSFIFNQKNQTLSFKNKEVTYTLKATGISVQLPARTVNMSSTGKCFKWNKEQFGKFFNVTVL